MNLRLDPDALTTLLQIGACAQAGVAAINLGLPRLMRWKPELARVPLLVREVFHVHAWFISLTLAIFAALTWRFAAVMAVGENEALRWFAGAVGIFWTVRVVMQLFYYSSAHWRGRRGRTLIHVAALTVFGSLAACYLTAAWGTAS